MTERKSASRQQDTIAIYQELLAEEEAKPESTAKGRQKEPRRRAFERMVKRCGFSHWMSAQTAVRRWEATQKPLEFECYGMELSEEFAAMIRDKQDKARRVEDARAELEAALRSSNGDGIAGHFPDFAVDSPTHLCPFCKACFKGCEYCEGDGWYDGAPMRPSRLFPELTGKLLDEVDIHVEYKGKVIPLDELP